MSSFIDYLQKQMEGNAKSAAGTVFLPAPMGGLGIYNNVRGAANLLGSIPMPPFSAPGDRGRGPIGNPGGGPKRSPQAPKTTSAKNDGPSRHVQAQQAAATSPRQTGSSQKFQSPKQAEQQFPKAMAKARAMGSPDSTSVVTDIRSGKIGRELARARGWITEGQYKALENFVPTAQATPAPVQQPNTASANVVGTSAGAGPGTLRGQPQGVAPQQASVPATGSEFIRDFAAGFGSDVSDYQAIIRNAIAQGLDVNNIPPEELINIQNSIEAAREMESGAGGNPQFDFASSMPNPEMFNYQPDGAMVGFLQASGIDPKHPLAEAMVDNAESYVYAYQVLMADPGSIQQDMSGITAFLQGVAGQKSGNVPEERGELATLYGRQVDAIYSNPEGELAQTIEAIADDRGSAYAYFNMLFRPMLTILEANDTMLSAVWGRLQEAELQYQAAVSSGYQQRFIDYLRDSGTFDPYFGSRGQ